VLGLVMRANLAFTVFFLVLGLGRGYVFATSPSDPLIIHPPHDGRSDIQHCCNDNRGTREFVVKETVSVLLCAP